MALTPPPPADDTAQLCARMLLEARAVHFNAAEPFTLASGKPAPTYIDCRRLLGFPRIRAMATDLLAGAVVRDAGLEAFDAVAGGETAGIPFAALIAERLALPMAYIRKKPKGYGRNARIEGRIEPGDRVLLIEDLVTDGGSKLGFVEAIRSAGASCSHVGVIFAYGIFAELGTRMDAAGLSLTHLCTWRDVLAEARAQGMADAATLAEVAAFLDDPHGWQAARG
jgi:orotate phosphoribosyltransferase